MSKSTAVAAKDDNKNLAVAENVWGDMGDAGYDELDNSDYSIPFLKIAQKLSKEMSKKSDKYIEGIEEGMIFNTNTFELFDNEAGLPFIPVYVKKAYVEWKLRENGGGLVDANHTVDVLKACTPDEKNRMMLKNGNQIVETKYLYGFIVHPVKKTLEPVVIALSSGGISQLNKIMAVLRMHKGPMFSNLIYVKTKEMSNDQGEWCRWHFEYDQPTVEALNKYGFEDMAAIADQVKGFYEACASGKARADERGMEDGEVDAGDDGVLA